MTSPHIVTLIAKCHYGSEPTRDEHFYDAFAKASLRSNFENDLTQKPEYLPYGEGEDEMILTDPVWHLPFVVQFPSEEQFEEHEANDFSDIWDKFEHTIWNVYGSDFFFVDYHHVTSIDEIIQEDLEAKPYTHDTPIDLELEVMNDIRLLKNGKLVAKPEPPKKKRCTIDR